MAQISCLLRNILTRVRNPPTSYTSVRYVNNKHWDIKWRRLRAKKVIKVPLPNFDEARRDEKLTIEEMRSKLKERGIAPPRKWDEKPIFISCTSGIFEAFVPPPGDGKISAVSTSKYWKDKLDGAGKKGKTYLALRKIRNFDYEFDAPTVAEQSLETYKKAHLALAEKDEEKLHELVTEKCFPEMMDNVKNKTLRWKFVQSLEAPRVMQIRCQDLITENSTFAQITIRFHMQQILAIYDRFGRLMHGSEDRVKDVLEYVVFEKCLTYEHGSWRIHGKIIPDWLPPRENILKTFVDPNVQSEDIEFATILAKDQPELNDKIYKKSQDI